MLKGHSLSKPGSTTCAKAFARAYVKNTFWCHRTFRGEHEPEQAAWFGVRCLFSGCQAARWFSRCGACWSGVWPRRRGTRRPSTWAACARPFGRNTRRPIGRLGQFGQKSMGSTGFDSFCLSFLFLFEPGPGPSTFFSEGSPMEDTARVPYKRKEPQRGPI